MTFLEMLTYVRTLLAEDVAAFWTDAQLKEFINRSYMTVYSIIANSRQEFFVTTQDISYVAGTATYALTTATAKIVLVERFDQDPVVTLTPVDITEKNKYQRRSGVVVAPGEERYYLQGNSIGFTPTPNEAISNAVRVYAVRAPTKLVNDGDQLPTELTELDHEVVAWGAYMRAAARDKQLLTTIAPVYKELKEQLLINVQARQYQEPRRIIDIDETPY